MKFTADLSPSRWAILGVTLLALALGGATELWEQALLALLAGALFWFAPPRRQFEPVPLILGAVLFGWSLLAFIPAAWSFPAPWRQRLAELQVLLPFTRTPQPWLTLQGCALLFVALLWIVYVLHQSWPGKARLQATRVLVLGVAILAAVALAAFCLGFHVPNWNQDENRGWFPNRNQTADVLAICAVINYALIFDCLRKRRASLYLWLVTLAVLDAALVVSYSRAGILMFFGGIALWHVWPTRHHRTHEGAAQWTALGIALVFVLLTLFFVFGGSTFQRFDVAIQSDQDNQFRWAIQKDAFNFSRQAPLLGIGLGNFEALFASARIGSANAERAIHPESDWLWAICELGWITPLLFLGFVAWWLRRCLPFGAKSGESLRRALTVGGVLFLLHGFVDVSAHRLGSLFVGLLVFSLAQPTPADVTHAAPVRPKGRFTPSLKVGAILTLLVAGWWFASVADLPVPPTTAQLDRLEAEIDAARDAKDMPRMQERATQALRIAQLNWHLYFQRAFAETFQAGQLAAAGHDFVVARALESKWVKPCFDEGATWLAAGQPDLCLDAWQETLRRATDRREALDLYNEMLALAQGHDMVHSDLQQLAAGRINYQLIFLNYSSEDETRQTVQAILAQDPDLHGLKAEQQLRLFAKWWEKGDKPALIAGLTAHPSWGGAGWPFLAESFAAQKNFHGAWATVDHFAPPPLVPVVSSKRTIEDLQAAFYDETRNVGGGVLLYQAQTAAGRIDDAISTLRAMEKNKNCPSYIFFLEARLWAQKKEWELAWNAWWAYHRASEP